MKKSVLMLLFSLLASFAYAQQVKISGVVTDAGDGQPVVGATVLLGGTTKAVLTDIDGKYSITAKEGQAIEIKFVGYYTETFMANSKSPEMNVKLRPEAVNAQDVVVVGYGTQRKRDISGAITSIKTDDIKAGMVTSTAQLLQGRAAGVQVRTNSSEPGGGITIRVRGASSISSKNDPLYVIDGFQTDLGNSINPADIESMEILKDASATAIYGARGANGVIIITTKQGKSGHFSVDYTFNATLKQVYNPWDLMGAQDIMGLSMRQWQEGGSSGNPPYTDAQLAYKGAGTDWISEATRTSFTQQHQINIAGGSEKLQMNISAGYTDDQGVLINTDFDRFSTRLNLNYKLSNRVRFGATTYVARTNRNFQPMGTNSTLNNVMWDIFNANPLTAPSGKVNYFGEAQKEPQMLNMLNDVIHENVETNVYTTIYAEADILKKLTARVQYNYGYNDIKNRDYYPRSTNLGLAGNGLASIRNEASYNQQVDAILTYSDTYNKIHNFKAMAGMTFIDKVWNFDDMEAQGFSTDAFTFNNMGAAEKINRIRSSQTKRNALSFFARVEYVLMDKYGINASVRADGSSNFGTGNKWGYFPSVSAFWQLGDESWMEGAKPVLSSLKLRASYGITGNDGIDSYLSLRKYATAPTYLGGEGVVKGLYPSTPANPDLKWEQTAQFNVGVDFTMVNRRIEVNFDWYNKVTSDLLNSMTVSNSTGGFGSMMVNHGKVQNQGWELFIKSYNIVKPRFTWSTTLNLSQNKNKVLEYNYGKATYLSTSPQGAYDWTEYSILQEGLAMSTLYGYVFDGILQTGETYGPQPKSVPGDPKFKDIDGNGTVGPEDRTILGNGTPDIILGFGNTFSFYNFDITLFLDGAFGHEMLNLSRLTLEDKGRLRTSMDRWTQKHASASVPRIGWDKFSDLKYGNFVNSNFVEDASYLRIQNIEIGYSIPFKNWDNVYKVIKNLRVYVGVQNLHTFTKYTGFTPDVSVNGDSAIAQGLDFSSYPAFTMFNFGAKITF